MSDLGDVLRQVVCTPKHIPGDWQFYKLTDICNPKQWKTISATEMTESGYPVFGANGFVGFYHEYNHEHEAVAITCRGNTCGTINRIPPRTYITGNSMALDDIKKNVITQDYLYYALKYRGVGDSISGSAQPQITGAGLRSIEFPAPPLPEQQKIATILSSVDDVIEKTRAQIDKLKDLKTGMMQELLTKGIGHTEFKDSPVGRIPVAWNAKLLDSVAKRGSGHTPSKSESKYWNGGVKWISLSDSDQLDNLYINDTKKEISESGLANSSAVLHPPGIVVMARDAGIGKSAITTRSMAVSQHFMAWLCGESLDNYFLYYLLQHWKPKFENIAMGSTIKTIGLPYFKSITIPVPPLDEQIKISRSLKSVDETLFQLKEKLNLLVSTKKALMQDLLTGKVRVNLNESTAIENG